MIKASRPFTAPKSIEIQYRNELYKLIKAMCKDYKAVVGIYRDKQDQVAMDADRTWLSTAETAKLESLGAKWSKKFEEFAKQYSPRYVKSILRMSTTQIKSVLKDWFADKRLTLFGNVIPTELRQVVNANTAYNVSLITSIATQYHERILGSVMRSITGGGSLKQLTMEIYRYGNMEMRRAKLIAQDQTRKVYNTITLHNCKRLGVKKMMWNHSHAVREARPLHIRKWDGVSGLKDGRPNGLDGFIFSIDNPPVIQEAKGKQPEIRGYPAQLPFCHCVMTAVLDE